MGSEMCIRDSLNERSGIRPAMLDDDDLATRPCQTIRHRTTRRTGTHNHEFSLHFITFFVIPRRVKEAQSAPGLARLVLDAVGNRILRIAQVT